MSAQIESTSLSTRARKYEAFEGRFTLGDIFRVSSEEGEGLGASSFYRRTHPIEFSELPLDIQKFFMSFDLRHISRIYLETTILTVFAHTDEALGDLDSKIHQALYQLLNPSWRSTHVRSAA